MIPRSLKWSDAYSFLVSFSYEDADGKESENGKLNFLLEYNHGQHTMAMSLRQDFYVIAQHLHPPIPFAHARCVRISRIAHTVPNSFIFIYLSTIL